MYIKVIIYDKNKDKKGYSKPDIQIFKGNYAIETMILKNIELYFGAKIRNIVEDLLKSRKEDLENGI